MTDWETFKGLCDKRDKILDQLKNSEIQWAFPRYLLDGSGKEHIPLPLVRAQEAVMAALEG